MADSQAGQAPRAPTSSLPEIERQLALMAVEAALPIAWSFTPWKHQMGSARSELATRSLRPPPQIGATAAKSSGCAVATDHVP